MITSDFDKNSPSIVRLEHFYGPKKHLIDKCLVLFSSQIYEHILEEYDCTVIAKIGACNGHSEVCKFSYAGEEIGFYLSPLGSALAGATIAEVNHLTGATSFIMSGSCGSLVPDATNGKFILPTQAYRGEGLSYLYAEPADYIDIKNEDKLASIFEELSLPYVQGKNWTTDSMLRETVNLVERRRSEGCITVEMELAGVQAVCDFYGFELYDFLAAGDVVQQDNYDTRKLEDANHNLDKLKIALEVAIRI